MSHDFTLRVAALGMGLTVLACGGDARQQESTKRLAPLVEAVVATSGALPLEESLPGAVRARNQVSIRPEIEGRVVEVLVRSGEAVERGQPLVRLDPDEPRERLRQAEADVRLAEAAAVAPRARVAELETRVGRNRSLAQQQLVSEQDLETLEAQLEALRASLDEALARVEQAQAMAEERRSELAKTTVRAPVSGRLGERRVEVGMLVDPSSVLFPVGDLDELIVEIDVPESMLSSLEEGMPALVAPRPATSEPIRARLSRLSPFLAADSFTTVGEIDVENRDGRLNPGMFVTVRLLVGESRQATLVPISAVWEDPATGRRGIFVVQETAGLENPADDGEASEEERTVVFRPVEVLAEGHGAAGVSGVDEGAWVVTVGQHLLAAERRSATGAGDAEAGADAPTAARVRPASWDRVLELQSLQDEDLLAGFLDKQRKIAAALGAEIPESEDVVDRVLEAAAAEESRPPGAR